MARIPPRPDADRVRSLAAWYLERYGATEASLRSWLTRRVAKDGEPHGVAVEEARPWIADAVGRMVALGVLDDRRFAESRARILRRRGTSSRATRAALRAKGVPDEVADDVLAGDDGDLAAARTYARKHRLGPWRTSPVDADGRRRELARLGRKGFGWEVARRVVDATE